MENNFFNTQDNFEKIINNYCFDIFSISQIQTGWTNFVFRVQTKNENYIIRFPRNNFFANALIKEYEIIKNIKNEISFQTPNFILKYDNNRPYTIHKEIEGDSLSNCYHNLSLENKKELAKDICKLLDEFYRIDIKNRDYQLISNFLDNLSNVSQNNYDLKIHNKLKQLEQNEIVFSHGDFNPGNLIVRNNRLVAIIDFSFAGVSSKYTDLSRIIGRCPIDFKQILIDEYEKYFNIKIDMNSLEEIQKLWAYVEEKYILYIKQNHKDIVLPNLV